MWKNLGASWAILLGIGFMMLANGLQSTLLGIRAGIEGFATFNTGIMMSGYFIGLFIGSLDRAAAGRQGGASPGVFGTGFAGIQFDSDSRRLHRPVGLDGDAG